MRLNLKYKYIKYIYSPKQNRLCVKNVKNVKNVKKCKKLFFCTVLSVAK